MKKDELIISVYGSHNAAVAMFYKGNYTVVEVERWLNQKNAGLLNYLPSKYPQVVFDEILDFLLSQTDRSDIDVYLTNYADLNKMKPKYPFKKHVKFDHHQAHAATAFYQSPFQEALTFTFDGGGDAGFFNVYHTSRQGGIELIEKFNQDLGFAYMILADHLTDIRRDPLNIGNLVYAGKLMGLCSYGKVRDEWLEPFTEFYETFEYFGNSYIGGAEAAKDALPKLFKAIGVEDFHRDMRFEGQFAWDIAATTQYVFEEQFFKFARPYFDKYPNLPVTLSGGCALNVILNARIIKEKELNVFVPPNTNDCGVAVGGLLDYQKPEQQVDLTYSGVPVLDAHMFSSYIEDYSFSILDDISVSELADFIRLGNIVGIVNGNSEHGPRALGNRSIICNPVGDMKDVLNKKVKNREWYRPFAPVVRLEDAPKYFDFPEGVQSRHMTYVAEVRDEWKDTLPAITHEDGTGRIQTVTRQQNPFLYDLITEFEKESDHGVLLNTSFNVNGKPILSRLSDALKILRETELDAVYYNGKLVFRSGEEEKYTRRLISENIKPLDDTTTLYLLVFPENLKEYTKYKAMIKEISESEDQIVLITPSAYENKLKKDFPSFEVATIQQNHMYYHEMIKENIPDISIDANSFYDLVKLLWIKPIMHKNYYRTKNHMFVSLKKFLEQKNIVREIEILTRFAKDEGHIIISGKKYDGIFASSTYKKFITDEPSEISITPDIFIGSIDDIDWLSVFFEGMFLDGMRNGIVGNDIDYLYLTYIRNKDKFKVL
jgi:carbamoyltransferase